MRQPRVGDLAEREDRLHELRGVPGSWTLYEVKT